MILPKKRVITARMRRLACAFVVRKPRRQVFLRRGPNILAYYKYLNEIEACLVL